MGLHSKVLIDLSKFLNICLSKLQVVYSMGKIGKKLKLINQGHKLLWIGVHWNMKVSWNFFNLKISLYSAAFFIVNLTNHFLYPLFHCGIYGKLKLLYRIFFLIDSGFYDIFLNVQRMTMKNIHNVQRYQTTGICKHGNINRHGHILVILQVVDCKLRLYISFKNLCHCVKRQKTADDKKEHWEGNSCDRGLFNAVRYISYYVKLTYVFL